MTITKNQRANVYLFVGADILSGAIMISALESTFNEGRELERACRWEEAAVQYRKVVEVAPGNADYQFRLGKVLYEAGELVEAEKALETAARIKSGAAHIYLYLGMSQDRLGNIESAVRSLEIAISLQASPVDGIHKWHARLGGCYFKLDMYTKAQESFGLAISFEPGVDSYWSSLCSALERQKKYEDAIAACATAAEKTNSSLGFYRRGAALLMKLSRWERAAVFFSKAIASADAPQPELLSGLAEAYGKDKKFWREIEVLEELTGICPETGGGWFKLGEAREKMNDASGAASAFAHAVALCSENADWHYRLGYAYEIDGCEDLSLASYGNAVRLEPQASELGVGWFHYQHALWDKAVEVLRHKVCETPLNFRAYSCLGEIFEHCKNWPEAKECYLSAVSLSPQDASLHLKLGGVLEKLGEWAGAADAYSYALCFIEVGGNALAKLAYAYKNLGEFELSCAAWLAHYAERFEGSGSDENHVHNMVESETDQGYLRCKVSYARLLSSRRLNLAVAALNDVSNVVLWQSLAEAQEQNGSWSDSVGSYEQIVARDSSQNGKYVYSLGKALYKNLEFSAASDVLGQLYLWQEHCNAAPERMSSARSEAENYLHFYRSIPIAQNTILYEAGLGEGLRGDPYSIFSEMLSRSDCEGWLHVWALNDVSCLPAVFKEQLNVVAVERGSPLYCKYLASAGVLVSDSFFGSYFLRREGQKYLSTIMNTPQRVSAKRGLSPVYLGGVVRNLHHASHIICSEGHESREFFKENTGVAYPYQKVSVLGSPGLDKLFTGKGGFRSEVLRSLKIDEYKPVILFLFKVEDEELVNSLAQASCQVLSCYELDGVLCLQNLLLPERGAGVFDCLDVACISDAVVVAEGSELSRFAQASESIMVYSPESSLGDAGVAGRERGISSFDWRDALIKTAIALRGRYDTKEGRVHLSLLGGTLIDGSASRRAVDFLIKDDCSSLVMLEQLPRNLIFGGIFIPNGITKSFTNLIKSISPEEEKLAVVVACDAIFNNPEREAILATLPSGLLKIFQVGSMVMTKEERQVVDYFARHNDFPSGEMEQIYFAAFNREFLRLFGYTVWGALINFEGYNRFWTSVLSACSDPVGKSIFLHSDMDAERKRRFPHMHGLFKIYNKYDKLVSVSEPIMEINKLSLGGAYHIAGKRFSYCPNTIDFEEVLVKAEVELDEEMGAWVAGGKLFIAIGRLSVEKDHEKLIRAFSRVLPSCEHAKLIIIGDGVLRFALESLILELSLCDKVRLLGQLENPFPILSRADCLVHSSNHEGQPMVILEAMVLRKPIIATDIPGNRGALRGEFGRVVNNDEEALARAIADFYNSPFSAPAFNYSEYNAIAVHGFLSSAGLS